MVFSIMTLFPDLVRTVLGESIIGRAQRSGAITVNEYNIRDYSEDKHHRVDDTPYGGGKGMLMAAPPIFNCYSAIMEKAEGTVRTVFMSPRGKIFTQEDAVRLAGYDNLIILCGHYEGVDQRISDEIIDEEISIGDYILTGGEIPACILVDAVSRIVDGVLSSPECHETESFSDGLLEYPQYTRPYEFHGLTVPDVLISGNHEKIAAWRKEASLRETKKRRPDLLV
ncbi:MAG: tRNA (guanosine(37)-N1)-methyltransferase TrmD [Clostridia bacterium]|nr:tRNA (guanosine(37)-N1)-methyltransferase TrmD [Clostridia bacterium]